MRVNGHGPFDFSLDTGAGTSLVHTEVAKELELEVIGSKEGTTAGGKVAVSLAKAESLAVADLQIENVDLGIVDLRALGRAVNARIDGDLGYNFFKNFRLTIDYASLTLRFEDPRRVERFARRSRTEVSMRLAHPAKPLILADVYANARGPFQFAIDTGTSTTTIAPELAKKLALTTTVAGPITTGSTAIQVSAARLQSLHLGGAKIDNVDVIVSDSLAMLSGVVGAKLEGVIGYNFLRYFKVVIDYPKESLSLL